MKTIILSLHHKWWTKMVSGEKDIEVRKTKPVINSGEPCKVLVYVTGGVGVVGEFTCNHIWEIRLIPSVQRVMGVGSGIANLEKRSCLSLKELYEYAGNRTAPLYGWHVENLIEYATPKPLSDYGIKRAPQSWMYLK